MAITEQSAAAALSAEPIVDPNRSKAPGVSYGATGPLSRCRSRLQQQVTNPPPSAATYVPYMRSDVVVRGEPKVWGTKADSGRRFDRYFCGDCGS